LAEISFVIFKHRPQLFDQEIGTTNIFKEVMQFLNLVKLGLIQREIGQYYKHKLILKSDPKTLYTVCY
jgi:hypothetical protein